MLSDIPPVPKKLVNVELLLGISATLLSLCALTVSIFQTRIFRDQQYASVWPHLQVVYSLENNTFTWAITNNGVGPAIIKSVTLSYQGKTYQTHYDLFIEQIEQWGDTQTIQLNITDVRPGDVIKSEGEIMLGQIGNSASVSNSMRQIISDSLFHFRVVYSDIYGNCWQNERDRVTSLSDCPDS